MNDTLRRKVDTVVSDLLYEDIDPVQFGQRMSRLSAGMTPEEKTLLKKILNDPEKRLLGLKSLGFRKSFNKVLGDLMVERDIAETHGDRNRMKRAERELSYCFESIPWLEA